MKKGDLVWFRQIAAGRYDNPPYSRDGTWRIGLLIEYPSIGKSWEDCAAVLYEGRIYQIRIENMKNAKKNDI